MTAASNVKVFWDRWPKARAKYEAEIAAGRPSFAYRRVSREVGYLDREMRWDIIPGSTARNRLVLRPLGDAKRHHLARLWLAAAPAPDATWEFGVGMPPSPVTETVKFATIDGGQVLVDDILEYLHADEDEEFLAGNPDATEDEIVRHLADAAGIDLKMGTIALADIQVSPSWDPDSERVDLAYWHPGFDAIEKDEAEQLGASAIATSVGDEIVDRWLGSLKVDPALRDGIRLAELQPWIDAQAAKATGDRRVTATRLDQHRHHVAVRFNAARKTMDDPLDRAGLLVVMHRDVADVEAPEANDVAEALRELQAALTPGADLMVEVSEARRLSLIWRSADARADRKAAIAWGKRHPAFDIDVDVDAKAPWIGQMGLAGLWREPRARGDSTPTVKTRPDGRLYRQARWIERHPRRVLMVPLLLAIGSIILGVVVPSMARNAALQLIGAAGLCGLGIATYLSASTYVTIRNNPALGCLAVLFDGWRIIVITAVSIFLVLIFLNGYGS